MKKNIPFLKALPFYLVFLNVPILMFTTYMGSWWMFLAYCYFVGIINLADLLSGPDLEELDQTTKEDQLFWYKLVTWLWPLAQITLIYFAIYRLAHFDYSILERIFVMISVGYSSGIAGIVIAHELIHRTNRRERFLGDLLLGTVLYGHFRTEHNLVHHRHVATGADAATARYNESIYRFLLRVLPHSFLSAWRTEANLLKRLNLPFWNLRNPFYLYFALALFFASFAFGIGGFHGLLQFFVQALTAVILLETTNYIEHYGLCRLHLGDGKYEHIAPRHSWNANHRISNYLMIHLQRHSDHHYKPSRRFPLLKAYDENEAPQLPYGYSLMATIAFSPYHWRKMMNPRVRRWRSMYYPEITDWTEYNQGTLPKPR